jgi:alkyl hydroperoxide reductase subunit AhpC
MFGFGPRYNYERFTREMLDPAKHRDLFDDAPRAGDRVPDFEGRTLEGDRVRLSELRAERNLVLLFGSATCPMTAGSIRGLNALYRELRSDDLEFLFVYVREAHPGETLPAHDSWEDKVDAAERFRDAEEAEMPIVVDDVRGSIHRKFGKLPNPVFVIDKSGRVAYRMMWAQPAPLAAALDELLEIQSERGADHAVVQGGEDRSMPLSYALFHSYRALERGGERALSDFRDAMGLRGRVALATSRVAEPLAENAGKIALTAAISGAVLAGGIFAGMQLRKRRLKEKVDPYSFPHPRKKGGAERTGTDDYESIGI